MGVLMEFDEIESNRGILGIDTAIENIKSVLSEKPQEIKNNERIRDAFSELTEQQQRNYRWTILNTVFAASGWMIVYMLAMGKVFKLIFTTEPGFAYVAYYVMQMAMMTFVTIFVERELVQSLVLIPEKLENRVKKNRRQRI